MGRQDLVQKEEPDLSRGSPQVIEYAGEPGDCDGCGRPLRDEHFFAEVCLSTHSGAWGYLCWVCTQVDQVRPAWGQAQFYERLDGNDRQHGLIACSWRCIAGGPPTDKHKEQGGQACG